MTEFTIDDLWNEIDAALKRPEKIRGGDITSSMYSKRYKITVKEAVEQMKLVADAKPDSIVMLEVTSLNGRRVMVLRKIV